MPHDPAVPSSRAVFDTGTRWMGLATIFPPMLPSLSSLCKIP